MKRLVFRPLKEEHQVIELSATQLQRELFPSPYTQDDPILMHETFTHWDRVESIVQETMRWNSQSEAKELWYKRADYISSIIDPDLYKTTEKKKDWIFFKEWARKYVDLTIEHWIHEIDRDAMNFRNKIEIECSWYLVIFTWEWDAVKHKEAWWDVKTAWSKRSDEKYATMRQRYYYPLMDLFMNFWDEHNEVMWFQYRVYRKLKNPKLDIYTDLVTYQQCREILKKDLFIYLKTL